MLYAIDRFITGLEKEVSAADFDDQYYIPRRSERFFCPECGLQVSWVTSTDNRSSFFRHPNRTETSPECDKRVDGRSELYLYERVGLPLFLSRLPGNNFQLEISFPPLGSKWLENAAAKNAKVIIQGDGINRTISVNSINFYPDQMTLVPVNFLPRDNDRFRIDVTPSTAYSKKWSDYAEGFTSAGAIFTYDETGGKKVHRDDSISPGRQYYVVSQQFSCPYKEVVCETEGTLKLRDSTYQVYCMTVNVSIQNELRFVEISNYFRENFGVGLLETAPAIIPLWPPVIEQDVLVPTKESPIYCAIRSGNEDPAVYSYVANQVINIPIQKTWNGEKYIYVEASTIDTVLSVDRKYVGREIIFRSKEIILSGHQYEYSFVDSEGNIIELDDATGNTFSTGGTVLSNAKMELYLGSSDHNYLHVPLRTSKISLPTFQKLREVLMLVEGEAIVSQKILGKPDNCEADTLLEESIINQCYGDYVPVPRWVYHNINLLRRNGANSVAQMIMSRIVNGKLPIGVIRALAKMYKSSKGG